MIELVYEYGKLGGDMRSTGVARIFVWGVTRPMPPGRCHPADATRPMPPSLAPVVYTFEALVGSWGSVGAPAVSRIMGGAEIEKNCKKNVGEMT